MNNVLSDVEIKSKKDKDWERKLKDFRRMFLGDSPNAFDCKILNEWVLEFDTYSKGVRIIAGSLIRCRPEGTWLLGEILIFY
jgi:hypothetical protein